MSLYHYVRDKQELFSAMGDAIMGEQLIPADEMPAGWREGLAEIGRRAHRLFLDHPWVLASWHDADRSEPGRSFIAHVEQTLAIVSELDFLPLSERMLYAGLVDEYAIGAVMHDTLGQDTDWQAYLEAMAATGGYPHLAAAFPEFGPPAENEFELGLQIVLDGIEAAIERRRR
jgi:AcrR family transcriptional regulator